MNDDAEPAEDDDPAAGPPDQELSITADSGSVAVSPDETYETWFYNEQFPGPEIRVSEGESLQIDVENQLPEGTTIHWHGIPLQNARDGVPGVTQDPIESGESFTYEFEAAPPGTYVYHSHVGLQLDRGLYGPLIIEEESPHIEYDREYILLVDDYPPGEPQLEDGRGPGGPGGMMRARRPPYEGILFNGQLSAAPPEFDVEEGDRVRLRVINPSSSTTYRVAVAGHPLQTTHADGQPIDPVEVDAFHISMGERYDAIIEADNPGAWTISAVPVDGNEPPAEGILRYDTVDDEAAPEDVQQVARILEYRDLDTLSPLEGIDGEPDQTFDLTLAGRRDGWTIGGQAYPDADPLVIQEGEHIRVRIVNHSPMIHPMHLHGHFFQVENAVKDTVLVPPHMGRVEFDFVADNPGDWLFHCHNTYHSRTG